MPKSRRLPVDERLEQAAKLVLRSRIFFDIWSYFESKDTRPAIIDTMNYFSDYFRFDPHAHFVAFIVHIAALFEKRRDSINLPDLARELKQSNLISAQKRLLISICSSATQTSSRPRSISCGATSLHIEVPASRMMGRLRRRLSRRAKCAC
jgi:hypothetical protein